MRRQACFLLAETGLFSSYQSTCLFAIIRAHACLPSEHRPVGHYQSMGLFSITETSCNMRNSGLFPHQVSKNSCVPWPTQMSLSAFSVSPARRFFILDANNSSSQLFFLKSLKKFSTTVTFWYKITYQQHSPSG